MAAKFTVFFALCAVAAVQAQSTAEEVILSEVDNWASKQPQWLQEHGSEFVQWVDNATANYDVSEDIKKLLTDFQQWAKETISNIVQEFEDIKQEAANATGDAELQQLKEAIKKIEVTINDAIVIVNKRADEIYAAIDNELPNATSQQKEDLVKTREELNERVEDHVKWRDETNSEGEAIVVQIEAKYRADEVVSKGQEVAEQARKDFQSTLEKGKERLSNITAQVHNRTQEVKSRVNEGLEVAKEGIHNLFGKLRG